MTEPHCVAACYRCLLSYYNQPDHELLDRRRRTRIGTLPDRASKTVGPQQRPSTVTPRDGRLRTADLPRRWRVASWHPATPSRSEVVAAWRLPLVWRAIC